MQVPKSYEFGPFRFSPAKHKLLKNGMEVKGFQNRTSEVLQVLIESKERRITTQEVLAKVWGNRNPVASGSLYYQIHVLRQILDDDKSNPMYIDVKKKEGIQFIGNVREWPEDNDHRESKKGAQAFPTLPMPIISTKLRLPFGVHLWHILTSSIMYASLYVIALLIEVAYQWNLYKNPVLKIAPLVFTGIFIISVIGFALDWKLTSEGKSKLALAVSMLVFILAAVTLFGLLCFFLPPFPITEVRGQAMTAQAAYLKAIVYFLTLAGFFLILPYHFTISLKQKLSGTPNHIRFELLTNNRLGVPPVVMIYWRLWALIALFVLIIIVALFLHFSLIDKLIEAPYMNFFMLLVYVRLIVYFALGIECLGWYYSTLNKLGMHEANHEAETETNVARSRPRVRLGAALVVGAILTLAMIDVIYFWTPSEPTKKPPVAINPDGSWTVTVTPIAEGVKLKVDGHNFNLVQGDRIEVNASGEANIGRGPVGPEGEPNYKDNTMDSPFKDHVGGLEMWIGPDKDSNRYFIGSWFVGTVDHSGVPTFRVIESVHGYQDSNTGAFQVTIKRIYNRQ